MDTSSLVPTGAGRELSVQRFCRLHERAASHHHYYRFIVVRIQEEGAGMQLVGNLAPTCSTYPPN